MLGVPASPVGGHAAPSLSAFVQAVARGESGVGSRASRARTPARNRQPWVLSPRPPRLLCMAFYLFWNFRSLGKASGTEFCFQAPSAWSRKSEGKGDFSHWVLGPGDGSWQPGGQSGVFVDMATGSSTHRSKAVKLLTPTVSPVSACRRTEAMSLCL